MSQQTRQVPSVGRVVHYVAHGSKDGTHPAGVCRAAIIAGLVNDRGQEDLRADEWCNLVVLNPSGMYFDICRHDESKAVGTWHWCEYVPPIVVEDPA